MSTTTPSSGAAASISGQLEALVRDLERLDSDFAALRVQRRALPLARPAVDEVPTQDLGRLVVEQDDRAVSALEIAGDDALSPVPQLPVLRDPAAQDDVGELRQPGPLPGRATGAGSVLDDR